MKKKRGRTARREIERAQKKLAQDKEKLARLEPGGSPERPVDVPTASLVELRAEELGCLYCTGSVRSVAHDALSVEGRALRRVRTVCSECEGERVVYLQIVASALN